MQVFGKAAAGIAENLPKMHASAPLRIQKGRCMNNKMMLAWDSASKKAAGAASSYYLLRSVDPGQSITRCCGTPSFMTGCSSPMMSGRA